MTSQEQSFADDKMRAEINKLIAETSKINKENRWYVPVITSGIILALVAIVKIFL